MRGVTLHLLAPDVVTPTGTAMVTLPYGVDPAPLLADGSDSTWGRLMTSWSEQHMTLSTFTIPVNEYVAFVDRRVRSNNYSPSLWSYMLVAYAWGLTNKLRPAADKVTIGNTITTWTSSRATRPYQAGLTSDAARGWTQSDINNLALRITPVMQTGNRVYLREVAIGVGCLTKPVTTLVVGNTDVTRPVFTYGQLDRWAATVTTKALASNAATVTTSAAHGFQPGNTVVVSGVDDTFDGTWVIASTPSATTFTFAVTAANVTSTAATGTAEIGDSKQYADAELRLFTAAQVAAAGFSVDVTTPLWSATDHSAPRSADASLGCAVDLENGGVYRVYARTTVADHVYAGGASTITTDWVYRDFTMVIAPAGPAAVDAVWDDSTQSVDLVVTTRGNLVPTAFGSAESVLGAWAVSGCTVGRVADSGPAGSYVTEVTASGGGPATITMGAAYGLGVIAGERYLARVPVRAVSETRAVQVTLTWYDDGATVLGSVSSAAVSPAVADGWSQYLAVNGVAPAGATRVALAITVSGPPTAAAKWRVDAVSIVLAHGAADTGAGLVYGQGGTGAGLSDFRTLVERSVDGGDTWVQVRAPEGTDQTSLGIWGQRWTGSDYEVPRGTSVLYRAALVAQSPAVLVSTRGTATVFTGHDGTWWAKAVTTPDLNVGHVGLLADPEFQLEEGLTVHRVLGRQYPIVVGGTVGGYDGSGVIMTRTVAEGEAVEALLRHQSVILFQAPFVNSAGIGLQIWARVTARAWPLKGTPEVPRREFAVSWVDVGCPEVGP